MEQNLSQTNQGTLRYLWLTLGALALGVGMIGLILPIMPQVPFFVLAAYCFARSSRRIHNWMMSHKTIGPLIHDWLTYRAVSRPMKIWTVLSFIGSLILAGLLGVPIFILIAQGFILFAIGVYICTRPESGGG